MEAFDGDDLGASANAAASLQEDEFHLRIPNPGECWETLRGGWVSVLQRTCGRFTRVSGRVLIFSALPPNFISVSIC